LSPLFERIQQWIDLEYFQGASLLLARGSQNLCEKYWGNYRHETVEYIASAGKWLSAAAIMAVVDEGGLSLDDTAAKYLPNFTDGKCAATLRQMLAHTSGYPAYPPASSPADTYQTLEESVFHLAPLPPESAPGQHWKYGGLAMQAAGRMAEIVTGEDWETIFQKRIASPLQMTGTAFTPVDKGVGHGPMLGGGARSTLGDYANFLNMMSNCGVFQGARVLSKEAVQALQAYNVGNAIVPTDNFVSAVRGHKHHGIYGLGLWREIVDNSGHAVLISSPGWAGTYPWIDTRHDLYGIFLAHATPKASADRFNAMTACSELPILAGVLTT
jgi:CubicO group peptidase (beta-lactamase class C family)